MAWLLAALVAGSLVYCVLVIVAARRYLGWGRVHSARQAEPPAPLSVLKPLAGLDEGLESNLRTFFDQDYANFEVLFAVRTEADPAVPVVRRLQSEYPNVPSRLLLVGEPPYSNAKVWSLSQMTEAAKHDILVMSDSDIRVTPDFLRTIADRVCRSKAGRVVMSVSRCTRQEFLVDA